MEPTGISWSVIGPISTIFGALIGIGIGWGAMKSIVASLKVEVVAFKVLAGEMNRDVITLKVNDTHTHASVKDLNSRMNIVERDIATLKERNSFRHQTERESP